MEFGKYKNLVNGGVGDGTEYLSGFKFQQS